MGRLDETRDWSDPDTLTSLRIADLACGTGALLSAAYRSLAQRHRRTGGDDQAVYRPMMERALVAADIMPAATHLTASMLSSVHPGLTFQGTQVLRIARAPRQGGRRRPGSPRPDRGKRRRAGLQLHRPRPRQGQARWRPDAGAAAAVVSGNSWGDARGLLDRRYEGLTVLTIAAHGSTDRSFSADTGMAEALVVATKRRGPGARRENALFVNLHHRPRSLAEAFEMGQAVRRLPPQHQGRLRVGTREIIGTYIRAPLNQGGCAGLRETTLAETAIELTKRGTLRLPQGYSVRLPTKALDALGNQGIVDSRHLREPPRRDSSRPFRHHPRSGCAPPASGPFGTTTPAGSRASSWSPTPRELRVRVARTARRRSGTRRPHGCTSTATSNSTPKLWPPASRRERPSGGGHGPTFCRREATGPGP